MGSPPSTVEAARRRLREVVRRGEKLGLTRSDLASLPAARRLATSGLRRCWRNTSLAITAFAVILAITAVLAKCYVYHEATTSSYTSGATAASLDPWWQQQQLQRLCTISMPQQLVRMFRPPENCDMCRGLRQVDRIANISPANFKKRYTFSGHPVIVTDAMRNWTAQHVFDFRFLKTLYQQLPQAQRSQGCQLIATDSGFASLGEVFNGSHTRTAEPWHVGWRNCDERAATILRQHYGRPYFLPPSSGDRQKLEWIYLGSSGYRETMHFVTTKYVTAFLTSLTQLYVISWFGQGIVNQSFAVGQTAYNCPWYERSTQFRRLLLMVLTRAQKPLYITLGKLVPLSIELFTLILNTAYKFYTILLKLHES